MSGLGLILPGPVDPFPWDETVPWYAVLGSSAPGANFVVFHRLQRRSIDIINTTITLDVTTQNGNLDVGVYSSDGTTLTKLASSGSTAVGTAAAKQDVLLSAPVTRYRGLDYYLGLIVDGTAAFARSNGFTNVALGAADNVSLTKSATFPLPATSTLASLSGVHLAYWMRIK